MRRRSFLRSVIGFAAAAVGLWGKKPPGSPSVSVHNASGNEATIAFVGWTDACGHLEAGYLLPQGIRIRDGDVVYLGRDGTLSLTPAQTRSPCRPS